jgi:DNA-binding winged helix-turn-helix (wHTH) protein/tetratricopeptide (TPR) repeat protein
MARSGNFAFVFGAIDFRRKFFDIIMQALQTESVVRFGMFEADLGSGELRKNGVKVKVQDLPFRALKLLLNRPNEVLSRDQFRQALWPDGVFVDFDHGISSAINRLRDALGDSAANPVFIETVGRRGYRWIAPARRAEHEPAADSAGPLIGLPPTGQLQTRDLQTGEFEIKIAPSGRVDSALSGPESHRNPLPQRSEPPLWQRSWVLIFPVLALLVAAWGFKPVYRAAKANNRPRVVQQQPTNFSTAEAEQFYLKGRYYWQKRTPEALNKALDSFTQAIVHDANYAPAYVGLADCYNLLREYTLMPASEAYPRALAAAQKAVELDDQSSDAHASLAFALFWGMWDIAGAEREFHRALALNPNNAVAHHWYATYLSTVGKDAASLAEIERAQALDPASKAILADKGDLLWLAGRKGEGTALLKQLEATEPDYISPRRYLKRIALANGDYVTYLAEWRKEATLMKDATTLKLVEAAEKGYASGGSRQMLENMRAMQKNLCERGSLSPFAVAETDAVLGDNQEAIHYVEKAYEAHDENFVSIKTDAALAGLRDDPVYKDMAARLTFPNHN